MILHEVSCISPPPHRELVKIEDYSGIQPFNVGREWQHPNPQIRSELGAIYCEHGLSFRGNGFAEWVWGTGQAWIVSGPWNLVWYFSDGTIGVARQLPSAIERGLAALPGGYTITRSRRVNVTRA